MPRRTDIQSILIIGAGPIVIGQACEFDYSGAQACKALREEGYRVILVNSNPATIMTDPETADAVYIEPVNWRTVARIIEKEKPDALLPTMGGQTALNTALDLVREGVLEQHGVELIAASRDAIDTAEDREKFRNAMSEIGLQCPRSLIAHTMEEAATAQAELGFPIVIRPSFTLGGTGGGIAWNREEFEAIVARGLDASPTSEVLLEESVVGWKEFEMEVVRDRNDNCIIICSIENLDPMGVHTGDSITVAPAQTLTDVEYQAMRDAAFACIRRVGVETGGSNVQFALDPTNGDMVLDRSENWASGASGNFRFFRNTISHEHGHGIGMHHICPINQTKLMEPFLSTAFDGPRHDEIPRTPSPSRSKLMGGPKRARSRPRTTASGLSRVVSKARPCGTGLRKPMNTPPSSRRVMPSMFSPPGLFGARVLASRKPKRT